MYVKDVKDGVCGFYATLYTEYRSDVWIQWSLASPGGKACTAFHLTDLVVHHQSVQGGSFVNFFGLVKTTRVIAGKMHSQSPILKVRGTQQPSNFYISITYLSCILYTLTKLPT